MNPDVFRSQGALRRISEALVAGKLIVIRNAAKETFAEKMFQCLDSFSDWRVHEGYEEHFHYHHHNIYDKTLYPPELTWCNTIFASEATKSFMQGLSQRDCSGETNFSASWYLPGDHSLPHNDYVTTGENSSRQVAFVWHLAKNWRSTWGGAFYWCPEDRYVTPVFNTLSLFTVGENSNHFVTHVSPYAQSKRLSINGWWTGKKDLGAVAARRQKSHDDDMVEIL
jgi:Rps23 Pro-64 3,4-dihydroxylase Tpa1-like proline 4-hydroxylase